MFSTDNYYRQILQIGVPISIDLEVDFAITEY